jgi:cell division protein FtsB
MTITTVPDAQRKAETALSMIQQVMEAKDARIAALTSELDKYRAAADTLAAENKVLRDGKKEPTP